MFQAELNFRDLGAPLRIVDGALVLGSSFIRPLQHRMVYWRVLASPGGLVVMSAERVADCEMPSGAYRQMSDAEIDAELDALSEHPLDFAVLILERTGASVRYRASPVVSVPAYMHSAGGLLLIDWNYARLLKKISVSPALDLVLAQIAGRSVYGTRTAVDGLHRITADTTMVIAPTGITTSYPQAVEYEGPQDIAPGADIEAALFETVSAIIAARSLPPRQTAVEVSGGMDSALTALAAAAASEHPLLSVGAQFSGEMGRMQAERRRLIIACGRFDDLAVPAERFAPFAPGTARRLGSNVLPDDENYPEMFEVIFAALQSAGVDTLISGFGGDELYPIYEGEDEGSIRPDQPHFFVSAEGIQRVLDLSNDFPDSLLQPTCWQSAAARSQRLLRFGLWPIYPYINVPLAHFFSRLPLAYRQNRKVLRKVLTRALGNPVYEYAYQKENFGAVARRGLEDNKDYLIKMVYSSPLYASPNIYGGKLIRALESSIITLAKPEFEELFRALKVFSFFQNPHRMILSGSYRNVALQPL